MVSLFSCATKQTLFYPTTPTTFIRPSTPRYHGWTYLDGMNEPPPLPIMAAAAETEDLHIKVTLLSLMDIYLF